MDKVLVKVVRVEGSEDLPLPKYETNGSAGMDLYANVNEDTVLGVGKIKLIKTGIKIQLPIEYEAQVRPRSGLALKYGITVLNSPGTVDSDYTGEVGVILINLGEEDFVIKRGDRIAQMVINKITQADWNVVNALEETERGEGGFGSTGK